MNNFWQELFPNLNDLPHLARVAVRLAVAAVLGGWVGFEREHEHKSAGMRTHMLVALGSALFVLVPLEAGMAPGDVSRVIQGIAAGVGFIGAGSILKLSEEHRVRGLTTAACIWVTAAIGMAVGAGWIWPATIAVALSLFILFVVHRIEYLFGHKAGPSATDDRPPSASSS